MSRHARVLVQSLLFSVVFAIGLMGCPPNGVTIVVDDFTGMTQSAAETAIVSAGLTVGIVTGQHSGTIPAGNVISQAPVAGASAVAGAAVALFVSRGPESKIVPNVAGMARSAAETAIASAGLTVGSVMVQYSGTIPAGNVISQNPAAGASVPAETAVSLIVSGAEGSGARTVPNVTGMPRSEAQAAIEASGLIVGTVTEADTGTVPAGSIISQDPAADTSVPEGSAVDMIISTGEPAVPNAVGMTRAAAEAAIEGAGLTVGPIIEEYSDVVPAGSVIRLDPEPLASVTSGAAVTLIVSRGQESKSVVPDVTGMTRAEAQAAIAAAGLTVDSVTEAFSASIPVGNVKAQNPAAGASVPVGSAVALVLSKGVPASVPDTAGMKLDDAKKAINQAGLRVGAITGVVNNTVSAGRVMSQNPVAGTDLGLGAFVDLLVSRIDLLTGDISRFKPPASTEEMVLDTGEIVLAAKDMLLLSLPADITEEDLGSLVEYLSARGVTVVGDSPDSRVLQLAFSPTESEASLIEDLEALPFVLSALPDMVVELDDLSPDNAPMYQEYLRSPGYAAFSKKQADGTAPQALAEADLAAKRNPVPDGFAGNYWIAHVKARQAWDLATGNSGVTVGIVDNGFNSSSNSIDLSRIGLFDVKGISLPGDSGGPGSTDHGTLVTAFACASGSGADDYVGMCWDSKVVHVDYRIFATAFSSQLIFGLERAIKEGAQVINFSTGAALSGKVAATNDSLLKNRMLFRESISPALRTARRADALAVFSAGNDGAGSDRNHAPAYDPATFEFTATVHNDDQFLPSSSKEPAYDWGTNALIVAATSDLAMLSGVPIASTGKSVLAGRSDGKLAWFSRQGKVVGIAAPGENVSCGFGETTGTSFSAPIVSGAAGLIASVGRVSNARFSALEIRDMLFNTANPTPLAGAKVGRGMLDAYKGVKLAESTAAVPCDAPIDLAFDPGSHGPIPRQITVTVPESSSGVLQLDVMFLIDTTGSYGDDIDTLQSAAVYLLNRLEGMGDIQFGVASFADFPIGSYGAPEGGDEAFYLNQPITDDHDLVLAGIESLDQPLHFGMDGPESQLEGLYQVATGLGRDINGNGVYTDAGDILPQNMGWRAGALPIVILSTDADFHDSATDPAYPGPTFEDTIAALQEQGIIVMGFSSGGTNPDLERVVTESSDYGQLSELTADSSGLAEAIQGAVGTAVGEFDLSLKVLGDAEEFVDLDALQVFRHVPRGESRTFDIVFRNALRAPIKDLNYNFRIWARGNRSVLLKRVPVHITVKREEY